MHRHPDVYRDYASAMYNVGAPSYRALISKVVPHHHHQSCLDRLVKLHMRQHIMTTLQRLYHDTVVHPLAITSPLHECLQQVSGLVGLVTCYLGGGDVFARAEERFVDALQPTPEGIVAGLHVRTYGHYPWILNPFLRNPKRQARKLAKLAKKPFKAPSSVFYLANIMLDKGVRCAHVEFIMMLRLFIVCHGMRGLACLLVVGPPTKQLFMKLPVELRFVLEGMTLGLEALDLVPGRCRRGMMYCGCHRFNGDDESGDISVYEGECEEESESECESEGEGVSEGARKRTRHAC